MSRNDEPITKDTIRTAAELTWRQHQPGGNTWAPGTCRQCTPEGCRQLAWAVAVRGQGQPVPPELR